MIEGLTFNLAFAVLAASLGSGFQHGYNTGVINTPATVIKAWITESFAEKGEPIDGDMLTMYWSVIVSIYCAGGIVGGFISGIMADKLGRKMGLWVNNLFVIVGAVLEVVTPMSKTVYCLIIGRFLIGINSGVNAGICTLYLVEISPTSLRGTLSSMYQLFIVISILITQILGLGELMGTASLWHWLLFLTVGAAVFQIIALLFCPESPKYLLLVKDDEEGAQKALRWFRKDEGVIDGEIKEMKAEADTAKSLPEVQCKEYCTTPILRKPLLIAVCMMLAQQLSGINAVMFFSSLIFETAGLTISNAQYATIGVGVVNLLMTLVSVGVVDIAGRKTLLLIAFGGMAIDTSLLMVSILLKDKGSWIPWCCIVLTYIYVILFAIGAGSIPWFLVSEMFAQAARPTATAIAVAVNWSANTVVGLTFEPLQKLIGAYVFIFFIGFLVLTVFFVLIFVPETKGKTIEEVTATFK